VLYVYMLLTLAMADPYRSGKVYRVVVAFRSLA